CDEGGAERRRRRGHDQGAVRVSLGAAPLDVHPVRRDPDSDGGAPDRRPGDRRGAVHLHAVLMDARQRGGGPLGALAAVVLALAGVALALLVGEAVLRLSGFQYHLMPTVQFGWPDPQTIASNYADDPDLFWVTRDYRQKLRLARKTHPDVIFMGD